MKKIKKQVWLAASAAVIAGNCYLIFKDDSRADRTEWLSDWDRAATGDVTESFSVDGVVIPSDEYPVYFDASKGSLGQILVNEGDAIQPGTSLFEYSSDAVDAEIARLNALKEETERKTLLVQNQLSQLRILLVAAENNEDAATSDNPSIAASTSVEQAILEQSIEQQKLEEEVATYETLIAVQEERKNDLVVKSANEGYVKSIDTSLNNPILTISSSVPAVEGVFTEKQMAQAEAGLPVKVNVDTTLEQFEGSLGSVSTYPEEEPSVKQKSLYPFSAQLTGAEASELYAGLKASVEIVTAEKTGAVTVPHTAILKRNNVLYALVLTGQGRLEPRQLEVGLNVNGVYEVISGVADGEVIVINPHDLLKKNGPFVTPVNPDHVQKKPWNELSRTEKIKFALIGFLS